MLRQKNKALTCGNAGGALFLYDPHMGSLPLRRPAWTRMPCAADALAGLTGAVRSRRRRAGVAAAALTVVLLAAGCTSTPDPTPTPTPTPTSSSASAGPATPPSPAATAPSGPASGRSVVSITTDVTAAGPLTWGVKPREGWSVADADGQGNTTVTGPGGCTLRLTQAVTTMTPGFDEPALTDAKTTQEFLESGLAEAARTYGDFTKLGPITGRAIPWGETGTAALEFASVDFSGTLAGTPTQVTLLTRVMPKPGSRLIGQLSCPPDQATSGRAVLDDLVVLGS